MLAARKEYIQIATMNVFPMDPGLIFGPLGLVPAIFILYLTLGPYENIFEDKIVFLTFIGGMVLGTVILLIEANLMFSFDFTEAIYLDIIFLLSILFAFLDQLSKLIIVNLPRFHRKSITAVYGASLGIGFGTPAGAVLLANIDLFTLDGVVAILLAISFMIFNSSTGAVIGLGVGLGKKWKYFFYTFFAGIFFWPLVIIMILARTQIPPVYPLVFLYSLGIYVYLHRSLLPNMLHDRKTRRALKRQRTRKKLLGKI
jgi:hypothetical protein